MLVFMVKHGSGAIFDGDVYIISSVRRVRGLFSMRERAIDAEGDGHKLGDGSRVLEALRALRAQDEAGATRAEIAAYLDDPTIDVSAALGVLQSEGLVVCEGTKGYPVQGRWTLKLDI